MFFEKVYIFLKSIYFLRKAPSRTPYPLKASLFIKFTESKMFIVFVCVQFFKNFGCQYNQRGLLKIEILILLRLARFQNLGTPPILIYVVYHYNVYQHLLGRVHTRVSQSRPRTGAQLDFDRSVNLNYTFFCE